MRLLMAAALALSLVACGGGAVPPSPTPPPRADLRITQADDGKTVAVRVGELVEIEPGGQFEWSFEISDQRVLAPESTTSAQLFARASSVGTVTVNGTGKPKCAPNQACIQIIATFRVTVAVR